MHTGYCESKASLHKRLEHLQFLVSMGVYGVQSPVPSHGLICLRAHLSHHHLLVLFPPRYSPWRWKYYKYFLFIAKHTHSNFGKMFHLAGIRILAKCPLL